MKSCATSSPNAAWACRGEDGREGPRGRSAPSAVTQGASPLREEIADHVLILTIDRPEAANAVNAAVHTALGDAIARADADPDVRVVILTGAGTRSFCAGADLKAMASGVSIWPDDPVQRGRGFAGFTNHPISKPVIAAVNGNAYGGGCEMVLACDLVVAVAHATFCLPEVRLGMIPAAGGALRMPRRLPHNIAMEMLLTGEPIDAQEAHRRGMVNHVVENGDLMAAAWRLASRIACNAPLAVQAAKRGVGIARWRAGSRLRPVGT